MGGDQGWEGGDTDRRVKKEEGTGGGEEPVGQVRK